MHCKLLTCKNNQYCALNSRKTHFAWLIYQLRKQDRIHLKVSRGDHGYQTRALTTSHSENVGHMPTVCLLVSNSHFIQCVGYALAGSSSAQYILRGKTISSPVQK